MYSVSQSTRRMIKTYSVAHWIGFFVGIKYISLFVLVLPKLSFNFTKALFLPDEHLISIFIPFPTLEIGQILIFIPFPTLEMGQISIFIYLLKV